MVTWGTTQLILLHSTYNPPHVEDAGINEIKILPPSSGTTPSSVIQQGGRGRKKIKFNGYVTSWADYVFLYDDYVAGTQRTFMDPDTISVIMIISNLSAPVFVSATHIEYSIELMEA